MNPASVLKQTASPGLSHSLSARLSANGRFQLLLMALLLVSWVLTGTHAAVMAAPLTNPMTGVNTSDVATLHAAMGSHHSADANTSGTPSLPHDLCADHCLSVMLPASSLTVILHEVTVTPEIQSAHWQPWRADLAPPPPKSGSFTTLS